MSIVFTVSFRPDEMKWRTGFSLKPAAEEPCTEKNLEIKEYCLKFDQIDIIHPQH